MADQYSYNQLINRIQAFFEAHHFVKGFTYGGLEAADLTKFPEYPRVHLIPESSSLQGKEIVRTFELLVFDLPDVQEGKWVNVKEVLSDTERIWLDFVNALTNDYDGNPLAYYDLDLSINSADTFWESYEQSVTGWQVSFNLTSPHLFDSCLMPVVPYVPPTPTPPSCEPAEILDSEGNVLRTINSGDSFALANYRINFLTGATPIGLPITAISGAGSVVGSSLQSVIEESYTQPNTPNYPAIAQEIVNGFDATLESEVSDLICTPTPCDDASVTVNSEAYGDVASGGTLNVIVKNESGDLTGELIGGEWIVPDVPSCDDATVTVNSTAFGTVASGGTLDVPVEYENGTAVGSLVSGVWTIPNPSGSSIIPAYVRPIKPQNTTPYYTGDLISQYNTGVFDRLDANNTGRVRSLGADNYTLDVATPNFFSTTARYTFTDGTNAWNGTSFDTAYPTGGDYIIIDHLSHLAIYVANLGTQNWEGAIDACEALTAGGFDWRLPSIVEFVSLIPDDSSPYFDGSNPFRRGVVSGNTESNVWLSETDERTATTNAYRYLAAGDIRRIAKTTTSLTSCYAVANYDPA